MTRTARLQTGSGPIIEAALFHLSGALRDAAGLLRALRRQGIATAVVTSTPDCAHVLASERLSQLFDIHVDGRDATTFLEATRRLAVDPEHATIVVDSAAGAEAGARARFALVVGVATGNRAGALVRAGAQFVVAELAELAVVPTRPGRARIVKASLVSNSTPGDQWLWSYDGLDPPGEGVRESLCTLGNGYFATRGAAAESRQDDVHYPGTYVAGCYNRLVTVRGDEPFENESLVNLPNWLFTRFRVGEGLWLEPGSVQVSTYLQEVDISRGVFLRQMRLTDSHGRRTLLSERRIVHMAQPHLSAQKFEITASNWSGEVRVVAGLDACVANLNVRADRGFNSQHVVHPVGRAHSSDIVTMEVETSQSRIRVHQGARIRVRVEGSPIETERRLVEEPGFIGHELCIQLRKGETATVEKVVSMYTSRDLAISEPGRAVAAALQAAGGFDELLVSHTAAWDRLWSRCHFKVGDIPANQVLQLHAFHTVQTLSRHTMDLDVGVPARGLHGEGYRGHVFWDDVLVLPLLDTRLPELTDRLIAYRFRRLDAARRLAAEQGCRGALFPWQSGSEGVEETPTWIFNPRSGRWFADHSRLQRHVSLAVAYEVWQHFEVTHDLEFMMHHGAELLIEIARAFSSLAVFNPDRGRYEIRGVIGPDEFHDGYPNINQPGINNNAYTNVMVVWLIRRAIDTLAILRGYYAEELIPALGVHSAEVERWTDITRKMFVPFHEGVISQFEGYEQLAELDWEAYRNRYGDIGRLDLILEAEGDTPNHYKVSKQADTLMLFYLLSADELRDLFGGLGYTLTPERIRKTVDYYLARSCHGSTLSRVVEAWVLARSDRERSWTAFVQALAADAHAAASSSTAEGIHLGAMAGTLDIVQRCYTGLDARKGVLWLNPRLPRELDFVELNLLYRQQWLTLHITNEEVRLRANSCPTVPIRVGVGGRVIRVCSGETHVVRLAHQKHEDETG